MVNYVEVGNNSVSQGIYTDFSTEVTFKHKALSLTTAGLLTFENSKENIFAAYFLNIGGSFQVFKHDVSISTFYLWKPFSENLMETNYGVIANLKTKFIGLSIGSNLRRYGYTEEAILKNNILNSINTSIDEPLNLMYKLSFYQAFNSKLKLELRVTNYDTFIIQQITNPMAMSKLTYNLNPKLELYTDLGIMQAGLLNVRINYFGFYCRGGIIWKIK